MKGASFALVRGLVVLGLVTGLAIAATPTASFGVSALVEDTCLATVSPMLLGVNSGSTRSGSSTVSVSCSNSTPYTVSLTAGLSNGTSGAALKMGVQGLALSDMRVANPVEKVAWNEMLGTTRSTATGTGSELMLSMRGQNRAGQDIAARAIPNVISVTIIY